MADTNPYQKYVSAVRDVTHNLEVNDRFCLYYTEASWYAEIYNSQSGSIKHQAKGFTADNATVNLVAEMMQ